MCSKNIKTETVFININFLQNNLSIQLIYSSKSSFGQSTSKTPLLIAC